MKIMKYICHQRKDRSFKIKNHYFPLCSRCTGIYLSLFLFLIIFLVLNLKLNYDLPSNCKLIGFLLLIPMAIDGISQYLNWRESTNILRLITGILAGLGLAILILSILESLKVI
ncbi:MAG: DUF2085 domain-containing protein [Methanobrevibacter sp.]|jgi:uncharacterized membrane protein|nr:DUF2085 domain-containing protein [Candidatus Methanoflexus mossambicus]